MTKKNDADKLNTAPVDTELDEQLEQQQDELAKSEENIEFNVPRSRRDERFIAFNLVYAADRSDYTLSFEDLIENFKQGYGLELPEKSYALQLAQGTIQVREQLDEQLKPYLKNWKLDRLGCCTRLILRMALWELQQPEAIHSIIINEAVELAKIFAERDAYKFINGILDEVSKSLVPQEKKGADEGQE